VKYSRLTLALSFSLAPLLAQAADASAELFSRHPEYHGARLSPTGEYVSVITPYEKFDAVSVIKLGGQYERTVIKFDPKEKESIASTDWTDDFRIIALKAKDYGLLEQPLLNGTIYASDADGKNQKQLFGYQKDEGNRRSPLKDLATSDLMSLVDNSGGQALFSYVPWERSRSDTSSYVYRSDTHSGKREMVEKIEGGYAVADRSGKLRFRIDSTIDDVPLAWYRPTGSESDWTPVPKSLAGYSFYPMSFAADNNTAFALISDHGEPTSLYKIDVRAGTRTRLTGNETFSVRNVVWGGYDETPVAVMYDAGKPKVDYVDPSSPWAQLHAGLMKALPGQLVQFAGFSKDDNRVLVFASSDRNPGSYYLYDRQAKSLSLLFETEEWIKPDQMSPMQPIEFDNRDGTRLYGYYTAPLGKKGPLPMIVMPHGGPYGITDTWGYDSDVQFLASQGYAVLQINFRGSGARGDNFEKLTRKQWGTGIQDDITDGVRWAIAQGMADSKRICIYGASFGGYSAAMNPIRNPGMYRCAIGYAGVYDLAEMKSSGDTNDSRQGRYYLDHSVGSSDEQVVATQSPARRAAELDVPILLIHGKSDWRAPVEQFNVMEAALKKAGKTYEVLLTADEGHGFYDEKHQAAAYSRILSFLRKYNPAD